MEDLSRKSSCTMCQLLIETEPKVLPGCLHVFCVPCLNKLPLAVTDRESELECSRKSDQVEFHRSLDESCPKDCLKLDKNHVDTLKTGDDPRSLSPDNSLGMKSPPSENETEPSAADLTTSQSSFDCSSSCSCLPDLTLSVSCPKCHRMSLIPPEGFHHLQTSYTTANMASTYKAINALRSKLPEGSCEQCVEKTPAASFCTTCRHLICEDHLKCHKLWKEYAVHKFYPTTTFTSASDSHMINLLSPSLRLGDFRCPKHSHESSNQYKFFCATCEDIACTYCTLSTHKDGPSHTCVTITEDVLTEKKRTVLKALEQLNNLVQDLDTLAGEIQTQQEVISKKSAKVKDKVEAVFTEIIDTLNSRKLALFDDIEAQTSTPLKKLGACSKSVDKLREHLLESRDFVQENLNKAELGILSVAGVISDHSTSMEREYHDMVPRSKVKVPDIDFVESRDQLYNCISSFGRLRSQNSVEVASKNFHALTPSVYRTVERLQQLRTLTLRSSPLDANSDIFSANLMDSLTGTFVYPSPLLPQSGDGADSSSPVVTDVPMVAGVHVWSLEGTNLPSGIRVDGSFRMTVCEFGTHQVATFDQSGTEVCRIGKRGDKNGLFVFPQCTTSDKEGKMLVVDSCYRVQMFDRNGKFLRSVGTKGKGRLQFMDPVSVVLSPDKRVFVCERENHRIQVLKSDLSFSHFIGKPGRKDCEFYLPNDISISRCGHLYVADTGNHRIQILTLDGAYVGSFGHKGSRSGELYHPSHLCTDSDGVFVSEEGNHRVSVFNLNGVFVRTIGCKGVASGQFNRPMGVAIDRNKSLYVCDSKNNRIQVFK